MATRTHRNRRGRHRPCSGHPIDQAHDPFAGTVLDYIYNMATAELLTAEMLGHYGGSRNLITRLVARELHTSEDRLRDPDGDYGKVLEKALKTLVVRLHGKPRKPTPPREPALSNLATIARLLGFDDTEAQVLLFAVTCLRNDMKEALDPLPCEGPRTPALLVAAALNRATVEVEAAMDAKGRLATTGLLRVDARGDLDSRLETDARLERLLFLPGLDEATFIAQFLSSAPPPTLVPEDFEHLAVELPTARKLLGAALDQRRPGVNLLVHGPTGNGKSELARLLAHLLAVPLFVAGRENSKGESPEARERLTSLLLGNKLLAGSRSLLLFDELEDLFDSNPFALFFGHVRDALDKRLMSKQWFNLLLENNAVPTIWISNRASGMDPAFLRRFGYVIELGDFTTRQRRRAWIKHLGGENVLPESDVDLLAQRFDVSPAHIGTAVAAARLVAGGAVDRGTLETVLAPAQRVLHGRKAPPPAFHADRYLPELVNTTVDLAAVEKRVVNWRPGDGPGLSLCLYGPPGTGKSELVRYLAHRADRPLLVKRASDLISMWLGQTEELIAAAFEEARRDEAFLLFDEADSFLQDRRGAHRSWEITHVNEFLQQLEVFPGVVACTTNLMETLDQAALRRFVFKVQFKFLRPEQAVIAFRRTLAELGGMEEVPPGVATEIGRIPNLAPGDFAACLRRMRGMEGCPSAEELLAEIEAEVRVKEKAGGRVGF